MSAERVLVILLRTLAAVLLLALPCACFPYSWMDAVHEGLGMGRLPREPIVGYLARSLSAMYAVNGGLAWLLSCDVRRFAPVIRFEAVASILFGAGIYVVGALEGMPAYWVWAEGPLVVLLGVALLWLVARVVPPAEDRS